MALVPLLHRIIVRPKTVEEANETYKKMKALGLAIPESTDKKREDRAVEVGTIVSIGDTAFLDFKAKTIPVPGDVVYYAKYAGKVVKNGEEELLTLNDEDLIAIVREE